MMTIVLVLAAVSASAAFGNPGPLPGMDSLNEPLSLAGEWKIVLGDSADYARPGFNDGSWDSFYFPGSVQLYSREKGKGYSGIFWARKKIFIDKSLAGQGLGLVLGRIGNADETFFNGVKIGGEGGFAPNEYSMWNHTRHYFIPSDVIRYGQENVIAVRVSYFVYAEILGDLAVTGYNYWQRDAEIKTTVREYLNFFIMGMGATLLIIFSIFFFRRPEEKEYFYYALQFIFGFIILLDLCTTAQIYPSILVRFKTLALSWVGINVAHPIFLHRLYDLKRAWIERVLWSYLALILIINVFFTDESNIVPVGLIIIILSISLGLYEISCHITALYKKKLHAYFFSFFGIAVVLGAIHDGMVYLGKFSGNYINIAGYRFDDMYFQYSAGLFYMGIAMYLVYLFIEMTRSVENTNANLEHLVLERTEQLDEAMKNLEKKNSLLTDLALKDSLTGLYNHAAIHDRLEEILEESKRFGFPLCVIMMDLDDFKGLNDRYGHQLGDAILIKIAEILKAGISEFVSNNSSRSRSLHRAALRRYDLVGRYGGDEFLMGLTHCSGDQAEIVMERIKKRLENMRFEAYPGVRIAGSFGIAVLHDAKECDEMKNIIALADRALYKVKSEGGNSIFILNYGQQDN